MKPVELAKDIFWIGAVDYNKRNFHGYSRSPRGTTYNSYLIRDEKNVVFDTVDNDYAGTMSAASLKRSSRRPWASVSWKPSSTPPDGPSKWSRPAM